MLNKKKFSHLRRGGLSLLLGVLFIGFFGFSTAQAAATSVDTVGAQDTLSVQLQNKTVQDSVVAPTIRIAVVDTTNDSVAVSFANAYFKFAKKGPYAVKVNGAVNYSKADSARVNATGDTLFIKIKGPLAFSDADTLTIAGVYVKAVHTNPVYSDGSTQDNFKFGVDSAGSYTAGSNPGALFKLLPGSIWTPIISAQPTTPVTAGGTITATLTFQDKFGNVPNDKTTSVSVAALLDGTSTGGNGILSGTSTITKTATTGAPGVDTYQWTALTYSKAENIQLKFTAPGSSVTSNTIVVNPGTAAAHISVSGNATTTTVDGNIKYTLYVTDANFNPIGGAQVSATEKTPHGGTFSTIAITDASGKTTTTFTPSKFFTGSDVLVFSDSAASQSATITVGPGPVGGIIVDYAGTADGSGVTENIAAGVIVYARGFLRDTYGNPISATQASDITFTISGKDGKNTHLGTPALTSAINQPLYQNNNKQAVGVAIPYTVSTNVRGAVDSILATSGNYTATLTIQNRSNVPTKLKMYQTTGSDSSIIASAYTNNALAYSDTLWDAYGNKVVDPGTSVTIAPKHTSYGVVFTTNGHTAFVGADTTTVDTLYPNVNGAVTRVVSSAQKSGMDTVKTWSVASSSVKGWMPVWVTPATFDKLVITPHVDTNAIAGQTQTLTIEKEDSYGNHIDWGLSGGELRGNSPGTTMPSAIMIATDSTNVTVDTVSSGHNRGGYTDKTKSSVTGKAGVASVGGTLNFTIPFTAYTAGADTQKVYANLAGGTNDTSTIYSAPTGALAGFQVKVTPVGSDKLTGVPVGDSVVVTVTAVDANGHRIYTYATNGQTLTVNHTAFDPISSKDTTYYFSYIKGGKAIHVTGANLQDTVFNQGQAVFYLFKFRVDSVNTVTVSDTSFSATSTNITYKPLDANFAYGYWNISVPSPLQPTGPLTFTVTPRDKYYNVSRTPKNIIVNISSNQTSGFNVGSNPKVINGPQTFTGSLTDAKDSLIIYVFDSNNNNILGQSAASMISATTSYAVSGKVMYGDGTMGVKNVVVTLNPGGMTDTTNASGAYSFANVANGSYTVSASSSNTFLGVNSTDALWASQFYNSARTLSAVQQLAADVNANGAVNNTDALLIVRRSVGLDSSFASGDWVFTTAKVTVNGSNVTSDLQGLVAGDVNESDSSQVSTLKRPEATVALASEGQLSINGKEEFTVPVKISGAVDLSAISLRFTYPQDLATFEGVSSRIPVLSNGANGKIAIGWADFSGKNSLKLKDGESIVMLKFKPTKNFKAGTKFDVQLNGSNSELADSKGNVLDNSKLTVASVEVNVPKEFALRQNYPNPFNPTTIIEYDLPVKGNVSLIIYNILGQRVATLVNQVQNAGVYKFDFNASNLASGTYIYRLAVQGDNGKSFSQVHKMILLK